MINLLSNTSFLLGALFLGYFTYIDYKHSEIENKPILAFFILALVFSYMNHQMLLDMALMGFMGVFGVYLWHKEALGGADAKILPCLIPFMGMVGLGESFGGLLRFLIIFGIIGTIYGITAKWLIKNKEVPFVPAIFLSFVVLWLPKLG